MTGLGGGAVHDAIVVGGGHNGLVAAALLARAGRDARLSRYSYLVSLFPRALLAELGARVELRARRGRCDRELIG